MPLDTQLSIDAKALAMIRKMKSGEYRIYSIKVDPKTGKRRNLGMFAMRKTAESRAGNRVLHAAIDEPTKDELRALYDWPRQY